MATKHIHLTTVSTRDASTTYSYCGEVMPERNDWRWRWDQDPETCERCARAQRSEARAVVAAGRMGS